MVQNPSLQTHPSFTIHTSTLAIQPSYPCELDGGLYDFEDVFCLTKIIGFGLSWSNYLVIYLRPLNSDILIVISCL